MEPSAQNEKRSTRKTVSLTPEQALEILQQSLIYCQQAQIEVDVLPVDNVGDFKAITIMLADVELIDGNLVMVAK